MTAAEAAVVPYKNAAPEGTDPSRSRSTAACSAYSRAAICYADAKPREGPTAYASIQNISGLPQGLAGHSAAG
jgi:hypothetical protein